MEDHLKKLREEDGVASGDEEEGDEAAWDGWDVGEDSSDESSDGWVSVESDGEDLEISDSEDEDGKSKSKRKANGKKKAGEDEEHEVEEAPAEPARVSSLATSKVGHPSCCLSRR